MRHGTQILHRVALRLDGEVGRGGALDRNLGGLDLERLLGVRRQHEGAAHDDGRADVELRDLGEVRQLGGVDDLDGVKIGAVGQDEEAEVLGGAQIAHPAADADLPAGVLLGFLEQRTE